MTWVMSDGKLIENNTGLPDADLLAKIENNQTIMAEINKLESSIDTPRIRREYAEGVRKQVQGISPTSDELWSVNKVQAVDNEIGVLRSQLK